jgi:hypothetical protein
MVDYYYTPHSLPILAHWSELCNDFAFWDSGFCSTFHESNGYALFPPLDTLTSPLLLHVRISSLKSPSVILNYRRLLGLPVNTKVHTHTKSLPKWLISHTLVSQRLSLWMQSKSRFFTLGVHNNLWKNAGVDPQRPLIACHFLLPISTRGVSCGRLAIYIKKCLKAKEELWKFKYFTTHTKI